MKKALLLMGMCCVLLVVPVTAHAATDENPSPTPNTNIIINNDTPEGYLSFDANGNRISPKTGELPITELLGAAALVSAAGCGIGFKKKH